MKRRSYNRIHTVSSATCLVVISWFSGRVRFTSHNCTSNGYRSSWNSQIKLELGAHYFSHSIITKSGKDVLGLEVEGWEARGVEHSLLLLSLWGERFCFTPIFPPFPLVATFYFLLTQSFLLHQRTFLKKKIIIKICLQFYFNPAKLEKLVLMSTKEKLILRSVCSF